MKMVLCLLPVMVPKCIAFQTKKGASALACFHRGLPLQQKQQHHHCRNLVSLHGSVDTLSTRRRRSFRTSLFSERTHALIGDERPVDPSSIDAAQVEEAALRLADWWTTTTSPGSNNNVVCLTGAGVSTESGIPDYRGANGSYHRQHKPMRHDQFVSASCHHRQRYWARGLVGFQFLNERRPAAGHVALATLERHEWLGVSLEDSDSSSSCPKELYPEDDKHDPSSLNFGQERRVSVITQNVDSLHRRAGTRHLVELHGRTDLVECLHCGHTQSRNSFHQELEAHNPEWFLALQQQQQQQQQPATMRADGDAQVADLEDHYSQLHIPSCSNCRIGFYKPSVVFFGDSVPRHRVRLCEAVIQRCDKLLVVGSSLAVHSAYRHVKAAREQNKDICILNVGTTRAEVEGLLDNNVVPTSTTRTSGTSSNPRRLKLEAPAGPVLHRVVELLLSRDMHNSNAVEDDLR